MKNRTFDEMISHFNITVSEMQITQKQKMELLGMITAIAMKHNESVKHGHWIQQQTSNIYKCSVCGERIYSSLEVGNLHEFCRYCGAKMDEVTE